VSDDGGLLVALPAAHAEEALNALRSRQVEGAAIIGEIAGSGSGRIRVDLAS